MIDRWSEELTTLLLASFISFGLPFAGVEYFSPHLEGDPLFAVNVGSSWPRVLELALVMTIAALPLHILPLVLTRSHFGWNKLPFTIIAGVLIQAAAIGLIYALNDGRPWWGNELPITVAVTLGFGCVAVCVAHRSLRLKLSAEKL